MLGLAASLSHRGVRHVRIPTTVLSQNDSGVGVKNGINLFGKKNFMGSFQPPVAVINDSGFLTTLHERDWRAGMSEAIKVALIKDEHFFAFLEEKASLLRERNMEAMKHLIYRCAEMHMEHIAKGDPFESGSSRPLDFGHWAAHKLEQLTRHELRHGEAVAIGIALDCTYALLTGMLPQPDWQRIIRLIEQLSLPLYHEALSQPDNNNPEVLSGLEEFREHLGGQLTIMLLSAIGTGTEVHHIDHSNMKKAIQYLADLHHTSLAQTQNQAQYHS
jgi:3-dehydroquinate synthase